MADTTKELSDRDYQQTLKHSYNDVDGTLSVNGFLVGLVGRKVTRTLTDSVTEDYEFSENGTVLYTIRLIYTSSTLETLLSAERIS
jgi:hypothetical protein